MSNLDDRNMPADKVLFIVKSIDNIDGTLDFQCETPAAFLTEADAISYCKEDEHGAEFVIYRSTPIWIRKRRMVMLKAK
jgi:hypothetical protein